MKSSAHAGAVRGRRPCRDGCRGGTTARRTWKRSTTVRRTIHDAAILSDVVAGFFSESKEEHGETLPLMEEAKFDRAFVFACSLRGKTHAHRTAEDDGPGQRQEPEAERDRRGVPTERALEELRGGGAKSDSGGSDGTTA